MKSCSRSVVALLALEFSSAGAWAQAAVLQVAPRVDVPLGELQQARQQEQRERFEQMLGSLSWLQPSLPEFARSKQGEALKYLQGKVGREMTAPEYPHAALMGWVAQRHRALSEKAAQGGGADAQAQWPLLYEELLIARDLLTSPREHDAQRAVSLAWSTSLAVKNHFSDYTLAGLISEGFLLPYASLVREDGPGERGESRKNILLDAAFVWRQSGQLDKSAAAYRLCIEHGSDFFARYYGTINDWADMGRLSLGQVLEQQGDKAGAIRVWREAQSAQYGPDCHQLADDLSRK